MGFLYSHHLDEFLIFIPFGHMNPVTIKECASNREYQGIISLSAPNEESVLKGIAFPAPLANKWRQLLFSVLLWCGGETLQCYC